MSTVTDRGCDQSGTLSGTVVAVRGTVLDVRFEGRVPPLGAPLRCWIADNDSVSAVVHAHLGGSVVRTVAIVSTRGLKRASPAECLGETLTVPVGAELLGRVIDLHGRSLDGGPPLRNVHEKAVRQEPPRPRERRLSGEPYPTGIKVIDLLCPFTHGSCAAVFGGAGVGKTNVLAEFIHHAVEQLKGVTVFAGIGERSREGLELWEEMKRRGVLDRTVMVFGRMKEPPGARFLVGPAALSVAEYFRDVGLRRFRGRP